MKLTDKTAVITGGASGLGAAAVQRMLDTGARVAIFDVQPASPALLASYPDTLRSFHVDVADAGSVAAGIAATLDAFGSIQICANVAGVVATGLTATQQGALPLAEFKRVIDINLVGSFNVASQVAVAMMRNEPDPEHGERGVIIHTGSISGTQGPQGMIAYATSKGALEAMTLPMSRDLAAHGIRVNTIAAGFFETPMSAVLPPEVHDYIVSSIEFPKRGGDPAEFAAMLCFIVETAYVNGGVLPINGAAFVPPR
ncbi:MAG: SDR family NAD(P)-dependent oxidoreductase [Pseudomonadota bacterium]